MFTLQLKVLPEICVFNDYIKTNRTSKNPHGNSPVTRTHSIYQKVKLSLQMSHEETLHLIKRMTK